MEYPNVDIRNIPRGRCKDCSCVKYDGVSSGGKKCGECSHPPGKHVNLSLPVCRECGLNTSPDFDYCTPACRNVALKKGYLGTIDVSALEKCLEPVKINKCQADGCSNSVYYEYTTAFSYCSPKCRDDHMLIENQELLHREIKQMEDSIVSSMKMRQHGGYSLMESSVDVPQSRISKKKMESTKLPQQQTGNEQVTDNDVQKGDASDKEQKTMHKNTGRNEAAESKQKIPKGNMSSNEARGGVHNVSRSSSCKGSKFKAKFGLVEWQKERHEGHGIVVCNVLWSEKTENHEDIQGFLITGIKVDKHLQSFKKMQNCQLHIFDIIVAVNERPVKDCSGVNPQLILDELLNEESFVHLQIYSPYFSLISTANIISMMKRVEKRPTHFVAVVNPRYYPEGLLSETNGNLEILQDKVVKVCFNEDLMSSAGLCGLKNGDEYVFSVKAFQDLHEVTESLCPHLVSFKKIRQQFKSNDDIVLAIIR